MRSQRAAPELSTPPDLPVHVSTVLRVSSGACETPEAQAEFDAWVAAGGVVGEDK